MTEDLLGPGWHAVRFFLLLMKDGGGETCELHVAWLWRCDFDNEVFGTVSG